LWLGTIATGVGLTTAVSAGINGVLLRPLPFVRSERLVALRSIDSAGRSIETVSADNWNDWRHPSRTLEASAIYATQRTSISVAGSARRVGAAVVAPDFFSVIRPRLIWGRSFGTDSRGDDRDGVLVSEGLWRQALGGSPDDRVLQVEGISRPILGVVATAQRFPEGVDLWLPYHHRQYGGHARNAINWFAIGRLRADVELEQATADLAQVARRIREADPVALYSFGVAVTPLQSSLVAGSVTTLRLLMGSVGLVLLVGCANLTSANLARGTARRREMAIRVAIGAGRRRLIRQVLIEHLVMATAGGLLGAGVAGLLLGAFELTATSQLPRAESITIDGRVFWFAAVVAIGAGLVTGLLPALQASSTAPATMLRGVRTGGLVRGGPGRLLVGFEVAAAVVLVTAAGLLSESLRAVLDQPLGFEPRGVVTAEIALATPRYRDDREVMRYWTKLSEALRSIPGVQSVGLATWVPFGSGATTFIEIAGKDLSRAGAGFRVAGDGYFEALRVPLLAGRSFQPDDDSTAVKVAVVNRQLADHYWAGENPLGKLIRAPSMHVGPHAESPWLTVIGVVGNVRHWGYETELEPELYVGYRQFPLFARGLTAVTRATVPTGALAAAIRERAAAIDPLIPPDVEQLADKASRRLAPRRFSMIVMLVFGGLTVALAAAGVYGVLSFAIARRTKELAIRSALGATTARIRSSVIGDAARVIAVGVSAGIVAAWLSTTAIKSMLFGVKPLDPVVLLVATVTIVATGLLAALIPARRATSIQPIEVLRAD
jgi:predicted permease